MNAPLHPAHTTPAPESETTAYPFSLHEGRQICHWIGSSSRTALIPPLLKIRSSKTWCNRSKHKAFCKRCGAPGRRF